MKMGGANIIYSVNAVLGVQTVPKTNFFSMCEAFYHMLLLAATPSAAELTLPVEEHGFVFIIHKAAFPRPLRMLCVNV